MTRNRFHAICPYFAMFPEAFAKRHLIWAKQGDVVLDPFCGRGTTVFEALLAGRKALGSDVNPVAVCISRAKAKIPIQAKALARLNELEASFHPEPEHDLPEFFNHCFHHNTLSQILFLRSQLRWKHSDIDCFLAAVALGRLHGESHRSPAYFSNRMPRTISTKPDYSVRWWHEHGYVAPERDIFAIIRADILYRYASEAPKMRGQIRAGDVRTVHHTFKEYRGRVGLVITSPPYLDTTNFEEDQWLRLWFLGGPSRPRNARGDHRHVSPALYWKFLEQAWRGVAPMLSDRARVVIRIGGSRVSMADAESGLSTTLAMGLGRKIKLIESSESNIEDGQHRSFRPVVKEKRREYDFHWLVSA